MKEDGVHRPESSSARGKVLTGLGASHRPAISPPSAAGEPAEKSRAVLKLL